MRYFTFEEFRDWVLAQPNEKEINMDENRADAKCGCLMVQFGKHKRVKFGACGFTKFFDYVSVAEVGGDCETFIRCAILFGCNGDGVTNFGEAKRVLKTIK